MPAAGRLLIALLLLLGAGHSAAAPLHLSAQPSASGGKALPPGESMLGSTAAVYRPAFPPGARPGLLLLFHGAGGDARQFMRLFRAEADRRGMILLSMQSAGPTWDLMARAARPSLATGRAPTGPAVGADTRRIDAALRNLFGTTAIDPARIVATGFSDGASYALALGLANDRLFSGIVALSPGFLTDGGKARVPRVAIAHGRSDRVLPFSNARGIAEGLGRRGIPVEFLPFEGGHGIDRRSLSGALDFVLTGATPGKR